MAVPDCASIVTSWDGSKLDVMRMSLVDMSTGASFALGPSRKVPGRSAAAREVSWSRARRRLALSAAVSESIAASLLDQAARDIESKSSRADLIRLRASARVIERARSEARGSAGLPPL